MARKYKLKRRAERQEETRRRIVRAAVELHTTLGPAHTTVLAIAKRAGVERPTLYRHFPTSKDLFSACSSHHWSQNPPPNPEPWLKIADPEARLRHGLTELYEYYSRHEHGMWKILRDLEDMPELRQFAAHRVAHRERVRQVLVGAWPDSDQRRKLLAAALGHAIDFFAWRSLHRQRLSNEVAVEIMISWLRGIIAKRISKRG
jgi:AcrR family transcriptional regulator